MGDGLSAEVDAADLHVEVEGGVGVERGVELKERVTKRADVQTVQVAEPLPHAMPPHSDALTSATHSEWERVEGGSHGRVRHERGAERGTWRRLTSPAVSWMTTMNLILELVM